MLRILKLIIYYFGYQLGFSAVAMAVSKTFVPMDMATMTSLVMVASTLVMMWHLLHFKYVDLSQDKFGGVSRQVLLVSVVFVFAAMYVLNLLIEQTGLPNSNEEAFIAMSRNPFGLLSIALLAPILEELLFRKILCNKLLALGEGVAVVVGGIIFGLAHGNFFQMPYALLVGFMLSFIYVKTGKIIYTIGYHMVLNFVGSVVAPWVIESVDLERLDTLLAEMNPNIDELADMLVSMIPLFFYEMVVMGLSTVGLVFLIIAIVKKQIRFESGIIPPAKEKLFMNSVCTVGAAALVTVYVIYFVISIIPVN